MKTFKLRYFLKAFTKVASCWASHFMQTAFWVIFADLPKLETAAQRQRNVPSKSRRIICSISMNYVFKKPLIKMLSSEVRKIIKEKMDSLSEFLTCLENIESFPLQTTECTFCCIAEPFSLLYFLLSFVIRL
uniref:Uncharacterized protein n=1 Tax=Schistocephalus solidus TaxID=70667 RepID=A0A0X3P6V2_SCHSO